MGARGKYDSINLEQVERIAGLGLTDEEIGAVLGLSEATINNYKKRHPAFLESIKKGKLVADQRMVESLYKRGLGFEYTEVWKEPLITKTSDGKVLVDDKLSVTKKVTKLIPADPTCIMFWLQNRRRQDWRDRRGEAAGGQGTVTIVFEKPE